MAESSPQHDTVDTINPPPRSRQRLIRLLKDAAAKAVAEGDPWAKHKMEEIPAERVIRHLYQPETKTWKEEETIVKMEAESFTHGAMRFCYRLKKRSTPPQSSTNHRFHSYGWNQASNYVAKAYQNVIDGDVDTSEDAKEAVRNDIALQYEAAYWAERFNDRHPPKSIVFIRAYAMEFPDRPGKPWFAVERFISGHDVFGVGFTKHNTNSGFVDEELHRVTPQVFSAFSFYDSEGERLVADIQGVSDLYTDPQVLSADYRFGDGDLGPRGMALFFKTFRHNTLADAMGIPVFALSKNELRHQAKYEDDVMSMSNDEDSYKEAIKGLDRFAAMDVNRKHRMSMLETPPQIILSDDMRDTERRSNQSKIREEVRKSLRESFQTPPHKPIFSRSASDVDEVQVCLELAKENYLFDHKVYHRKASGEMMHSATNKPRRRSLLVRQVSDPMAISRETRGSIGKVHYQLAVLHGMGRFPEVVEVHLDDNKEDIPAHDGFSVLYHLAHAASMKCVPACLALGRLHAGLGTSVSNLLSTIVPIDFDTAKYLLRRAMESPFPPAAPKAAAGCLMYQIYLDEREGDDLEAEKVTDATIMQLIEDILMLVSESETENAELEHHKKRSEGRGEQRFLPGDKVEGNYFLEGNYYPGVVESVFDNGSAIVIKYDDDESTETLTREHIRLVIPPTATQTALGGPLSDEEALGSENSDETFLVETFALKAELAELKAIAGDKVRASNLYEEASTGAMAGGKMKSATEWSLKAAELLE